MSSHINSIILRYKNKTKKLGFKSKLSSDDLSYLIANHFDIKGKILGLKDAQDNFNKIQTFCNSNLLKQNEVYHVIVESSEIPQQTLQSVQKNQTSKSRNQSIHQYSEPVQNRNIQSESRYQNSQSHHRTQLSQHQFHLPSQNYLFGLSSMVTIVNNFKVWEDNFQDSQEDRTSVIALVEDKENQQQDHTVNNSLANTFNSEWVNVMNCLVDSYGDRVDYFSCSIKNREEIHYLKVFPSIIVYKGGQKVMEISLQNQAKTILRLLDRFLNAASGMLIQSGQNMSGNFPQNQYPQALLLMEQSVQQTDYDTGDIITIPANIPDQRELLSILDALVENNQLSTLDYFIFKCKILEKFDLFMRSFFETYSEFDQNSFKDYIIQLASQQNVQQKPNNDRNQFDNRNFYNDRPSSSAQPSNNEGKRTPSRQQTSNFGSDQKLGFSQEQLINAVIELETCNLLEIPILTQIKRQILQENSEIIAIIEGYLSNEYNKQTLSQKLKKAVVQTNQFDRPTSPWPKRDKIILMFQNIVSKQLLTQKEEEILRMLIEKNDQQLMGTFSDGRGLDELVKSLKRIASQYFNSQQDNNSQNKKSRSTHQSADLRGNKNFENIKVNNFLQQQQYQQVFQTQEDQNQQSINRNQNFNKKLDFNYGSGDQNVDSGQVQSQYIDQYYENKGSDSKNKRIQSANVAHQSSTSSAQFANNQRQMFTASPDNQNKQKSNFLGDINENSPLHTIQINQSIQQQSGGAKPTNILNLINDNNVLPYNQSDSLNKKLDQITSSQQQSNEDLQIFNSNQGLSQKDQVVTSSKHKRENSQAIQNMAQSSSNQKPQQTISEQINSQKQHTATEAQNTQQEEEELDDISEDSAVSPIEFMDEYIDQFSPEDYGMAVYLINQQNDDILQLFQEILQISKTSNLSLSTLPIKIMVQNKYKEVMRKNFSPDELNLIESNKSQVTTSIFAVHQSSINLRLAIQRDANRKQSYDEPDIDSNRQVINVNKGYQERIHADEVIQESNPIIPNDEPQTNQQQNTQDNQQYLQNQPFSFKQTETTGLKNNQYNNEQSYVPQEIRVIKQPSDQLDSYQERISNSAAKKQGLISLHNAQSETEITFKPITNESSDSSIRKRLRTESLQVETNAKFSPKNKKQSSQRQPSPDRTNDSADSQRKGSRSTIKLNNANIVQAPIPVPVPVPVQTTSSTEQSSHFGLINLKKLQQMDVQGVNTGMNVQDNDLNEILSNEINEFYCSYIYNENDRVYDEIVNLSSTTSNPISKKAVEIFSILYQVNDLEIVDIIEEYKRERNLQTTKDKLNRIANYKRRSSYSSIQSVNNKIGKFNLFKKLLTVIENQYKMEKVDFLVQQYLFLHDDVVTLAAFEAYCVNKNWREFVENLVFIEKMSLIKFNLNKTEISKLNQTVLDQLLIIYAYGRYLRNDQKKDLEIIIKQGSQDVNNVINQYDIEEIDQNQLISGIVNISKDISNNLRKEEYIWLQKYRCPSIEERDQLKKVVAKFSNELKEREIFNLEIFNQLITQANKNLLSALSLYEYNNDTEDFLENICLIYHYETSNDMKRIIREFARLQKWDQNQVKFLEQKVDDDEPVLMGAYYHFKKNETDKDEKQELKETFDIYLNQHYSSKQ